VGAAVALLAPQRTTGSAGGVTRLFAAAAAPYDPLARILAPTTQAPTMAAQEILQVPATMAGLVVVDDAAAALPAVAVVPASVLGTVVSSEEDIDYDMEQGSWSDHFDHIGSQAACAGLCETNKVCSAWTWVKDAKLPAGNAGQCWLKAGTIVKKAAKPGVFSAVMKDGQSVAADVPAGRTVEPKAKKDAPEKTEEREAAQMQAELDKECAAAGASCLTSKCCKEPGTRCFAKDGYWAQCAAGCAAGPNPSDQTSPAPWACTALGERAPGKAKVCSAVGENCAESQCCTAGGHQCFRKNETFGSCKPSCVPGPDMMADDWGSWSCKALGPRTLGAAPWVKTQCAAPGADCSASQCCQESGMQCYKQSQWYAQCKPSCTPGEKANEWEQPWDCAPIGTRTPEPETGGSVVQVGQVAPWVESHCSAEGENCQDSKCCHAVGATCYSKNKYYAACTPECSTAPDPNDDNKTWSCNSLGPKSIGLALKGYPSLYCFTLYMPSRYEGGLMKAQFKEGAGIFSCDGYDVLSAEPDTMGVSKEGRKVDAVLIPKIEVGVSQDGTAGNAKLFMAVWDKVIASNKFRHYDWTIKVDPDAVIIPWRVRDHMKPHTGENVYVVNCNKFPGSPNFPMMYGAVEIFSNQAMIAYAMGSWRCGQQLPWASWGEDYYMTHCLDFLGVGRIGDFGVLGDNLCTGANCDDTYTASFHPFKDPALWMQCWGKATAPR